MIDEKRKFERRYLEDLSARLLNATDGSEVDYCPINVSREGFSIFTTYHIAANTELILALGKKDVKLVVRWCKSKENDPAVFRCGLETISPDDHLDELIKEELSF